MGDIQFLCHSTVDLVDSMGDDLSVVRAARVSTGVKTETWGRSEQGLVKYLMREKHASPFEHVSLTFAVHTPIFVAREFMRHRTLSFNEESGRYRELEPVFYVPCPERPLVQTGKVGHYTFEEGSAYQSVTMDGSLKSIATDAYNHYSVLLEFGVAKEVARMCLPVNLYTSFYVTGNLRNWFNFLSLRTADNALYEIRDVAWQIDRGVYGVAPGAWDAWNDSGREQL